MKLEDGKCQGEDVVVRTLLDMLSRYPHAVLTYDVLLEGSGTLAEGVTQETIAGGRWSRFVGSTFRIEDCG